MRIQSVENNQNFGMKFINVNSWNKTVLHEFSRSKLARELNTLYPEASASFMTSQTPLKNGKIMHSLEVNVQLDEGNSLRLMSNCKSSKNTKENPAALVVRNFVQNIRQYSYIESLENEKRKSNSLWQKIKNFFC